MDRRVIGLGDIPDPLAAEETARLNEFARACKAATRAVALYPPAHPAIAATLARIVELTSCTHLQEALRLTVLPDSLLLGGRAPSRIDAAVSELAALLHAQSIGALTIRPGGEVEDWRQFLMLLGRAPDTVRADGGVSHLWSMSGGRHVELREIDYGEVLRERTCGREAAWEQIVASCLQGAAFELSAEIVRTLVEIATDRDRLAALAAAVDDRAAPGGLPQRTTALVRLLSAITEAVATTDHDKLEIVLRNMAVAVGQLSPDVVTALVAESKGADEHDSRRIIGEVLRRMTDTTIAGFVAQSVARQGMATERLAAAFQALVPEPERQSHLIGLARDEAAELSHDPGFDALWESVADLLTSYSDSSFVSDAYGSELSRARTQAIEVDQVTDDPPERMAAWLGTVAASAVRALDLTLLLDLLRIEDDPEKWREMTIPIVAHVEDLLMLGDVEAAEQLVGVIVSEISPSGTASRRPAAFAAIEQLAGGKMMQHIVSHLPALEESQFERLKAICLGMGGVLVRPLAEALTLEEHGRTRERLAALLLALGPAGQQAVERLKSSTNAAARRTAVHLLREFGGTAALPDLTMLLDDTEPQVQREAVRAILNIGTDRAYQVLLQALTTGTAQSREAIMQAVALVRDDRAIPLFGYILSHVDYRGQLRPVYLRAIESLGALHDPGAVPPLTTALYRGEWWAPRRTAVIRTAAAGALARIGTPSALAALAEAAAAHSRGVRAAARTALQRNSRGQRKS
jgi:HEAT repeat protein